MQIANNVFIVTGGASGLGGATSRMFVAQGGKVVIADVQADKGSALAAELYKGRGDVAGVHAPAAVPPEPRVLHDPAPAADEELAISAAQRRAS